MGQIILEGVDFFAYHGFYEEEQRIGNKYSVDIIVDTDLENAAATDNLEAAVDYGELYEVIRHEMQIPSKLLENIAHRIIERTYALYPQVNWVEVSISKYNPPLGGICHRSKVVLRR
jgi:7,8-dihydroneopterin aldolase/epimerase/oxygenase